MKKLLYFTLFSFAASNSVQAFDAVQLQPWKEHEQFALLALGAPLAYGGYRLIKLCRSDAPEKEKRRAKMAAKLIAGGICAYFTLSSADIAHKALNYYLGNSWVPYPGAELWENTVSSKLIDIYEPRRTKAFYSRPTSFYKEKALEANALAPHRIYANVMASSVFAAAAVGAGTGTLLLLESAWDDYQELKQLQLQETKPS